MEATAGARTEGERTVLLSTHLLSEVEQTCTRVGVIRKGRMVAEGTIEEIRGGVQLIVRAEPADRAQAILAGAVGADRVNVQVDGALCLRINPDQAGVINQHLVMSGLTVTEFRTAERSLEEVFMALTGTESGG